MKKDPVLDLIDVDGFSATPKYLQVVHSILKALESGKLQKDDLLPSINELSFSADISRDTVEKAYRHLKNLEVIGSVPGKGYFITDTGFRQTLRIFLLFNKLSAHKKIIYDAFVETLGGQAAIDFYIYNNDFGLFKKLIAGRKEHYSHYVIIPHFLEGGENAAQVINTLPKEKLILLDKRVPGVHGGEYGAVYENFENDIYNALLQARPALAKYHTLKIIFPENSYFPLEIVTGFNRFCQDFAFSHCLVSCVATEPIAEGEVYINLMEDDLVVLINRIMALGLEIGRQVGVISYNETALKSIILNGITTVSTDFLKMGAMAAEMVLNRSRQHAEVPFYLTLRASL